MLYSYNSEELGNVFCHTLVVTRAWDSPAPSNNAGAYDRSYHRCRNSTTTTEAPRENHASTCFSVCTQAGPVVKLATVRSLRQTLLTLVLSRIGPHMD